MNIKIKIIDPTGQTIDENDLKIPMLTQRDDDRIRLRNLLEVGDNKFWAKQDGTFEKLVKPISPERMKEIRELCQKKIQETYREYLL
jgi:hypothetical protein